MTRDPEHPIATTVSELRALLRADLVAALKTRETHTVTAIRTVIAAIDNAEAIAPADNPVDHLAENTSTHVAGAQPGVASTEAVRRQLSIDDVRALLVSQIEERLAEAESYDDHGRHSHAERLRREAESLQKHASTPQRATAVSSGQARRPAASRYADKDHP